jgi:O-acetyl-ADP-ribose deacetylase (regulator of RNase III)
MQQVDQIAITGTGKRIELWQGDLTAWPIGQSVDALVVSAFPGDYTPTSGSLIGALDRAGLSVGRLAKRKDIDVREHYGCWLSSPIQASPGLPYRYVVCFEAATRGKAPEVVGDVFRALAPMAALRPDIRSVAMPILSAGDQGFKPEEMLGPLLGAARRWMEIGHPVDRLLVVTRSDASTELAQQAFASVRAEEPPAPAEGEAGYDYDVFVSYSQKNATLADELVRSLRARDPGVHVFVDSQELVVGAAWQVKIFDSLSRSRKVVALMTPDYVASKVCQEEFNIAWIRSRRTGEQVLLPVYGLTASLPDWMRFWQYADCREGDPKRMAAVADSVLASLRSGPEAAKGLWPSSPVADPWAAEASAPDRMPCPRCAESIKRAAKMCRFCQLELASSAEG